ncbi:MAG: alpha/beta fold hydrolase [Thermoleophilia bacterium]
MAELVERAVDMYSEGVRVAGVLTAPAGARGLPGVVVCHGFACTMAMDLPEIAARIARAGYATLRIDYRHFGESAGEPRNLLLPERQSQDVRAAITFLQAQPEVAPERVGLWGTSFGGAVVLHAAAHDERARAVVASVPVTNGGRWLRSVNTDESWERVLAEVAADRTRRALEGVSTVVPISAFRPATPTPAAAAFHARHAAIAPRREVPWWTVEALLGFAPDELAGRIAPRALLLIAAEGDVVVPIEQAESAFAHAGEPKRLVRLPAGVDHFDVYEDPALATVVDETLAWLAAHL